mgnify:CR=1 FL=1
MIKSDEDFEDVARWRMDFCREFGVTINDKNILSIKSKLMATVKLFISTFTF